jgi:hypothetical protein
MDRRPLSAIVLALAGALQAAFVARGAAVNPALAIVWSLVAIVLLAEVIWHAEFTRGWGNKAKSVIVLLFVGLAAVVLEPVAVALYYPGITFAIGNADPFVIKDIAGDIYVRLRVKNNNWQEASCRLYLGDLFEENSSPPKAIVKDEALQFWASNGGDGDSFQALTINTGTSRYFDVAEVKHGTDVLRIASSQFANRVTNQLQPGKYRMTIKTNGSNCGSDPHDIRLTYVGGSEIRASISP